ncbi:hypothetical protein RB595_006913 [Gaeumannomyces hyphopodioides]
MVRGTVVLSLFAAACAASSNSSPAQGLAVAPVVHGAYIVEYEDGHDDPAKFKDTIAPDAEVKMDLRSKIFTGASIVFHDKEHVDETAEKVAALPAVKRMWPVRRYSIPEYKVEWAGNLPDAQSRELMRRQGSAGNDTFSPHVMTQVNQLRDKGVTGKGIKVAVIDSGIDYKHPALGGCFGPGCLVSFGYDLVGDAYNATNRPVPDADPMDCGGHGTHVSGIIAAQTNNPFGIVGAAADVTLGMFRVFGCTGGANEDVLIQAYAMAYESGADLITASIGGPSGWSENAWSVVVSRIVELGVPCIVSAGNEGENGLFYASTAADGKRVTAIASFDNTLTPTLYSNAKYTIEGAADTTFGFVPSSPAAWGGVTLPLWSVGFDTTDPTNACNPLPADTPDLSNHIVLVRRGTCAFTQKAANVVAKGARYIVFYNNVPAGAPVTVLDGASGVLAAAAVDAATGATWVAALKAGKKVTLSMTDPNSAPKSMIAQPNNLTGGYASGYTTWGPTYEAELKPQVAAPGGNILSTYPLAKGGYASLSGTSMAAPLTAAVYALIMNIRGTKDPKTIENLLASTAKPAMFNSGSGPSPYLAPAVQQGAGLIQASDAAYATTLLSTSGITFNDTDHFQPVQNFTISNTGSSAVTYTLSSRGAGTAYTFADSAALFPDAFPNEIVERYASIVFNEASFTVPAGGRKLVGLTATPPAGLDASRLAVYSGYLAVNGSDGSALSLPYMGVYGSIHSHATLDPNTTYLAAFRPATNSSDSGAPAAPAVAANKTFILPPRGQSNNTLYAPRVDQPRLSVNLAFGSPYVTADVVPLDVCGGKAAANATTSLGLETVGQMDGFPSRYQARGRSFVNWDGFLSTGEYAAPGLYKIVVRSLRVFGDSTKADQYDVVETVPFRIRYLKA